MVSVGLYVRLSDEDKDKQNATDESESIQNQKAMLRAFCEERGWDVFDIYCDEDYSGIDHARPEFNRLISDCENGRVNIVLCKSQSRFSRDMEVIERYIHNKFVEWNVRFISIVDRADSFDTSNKKARQINGLINEWYLEDISDNIRKTLQSKRQRGEFTGSFAPYGYLVDPNNKNHLVIDDNTAPIVREIFDWFISGWGYRKIAIALNERGIPNPSLYKQQSNSKYVNIKGNSSNAKGLWTTPTIFTILRNETYIGTLVQGKSHSISYKNKKRKKVSPQDWIRVEKCHEAVIDDATWQKAQEKLSGQKRTSSVTMERTPLSGIVKCAVCGSSMKRHVYYNKERTIRYYNLVCSAYKNGAMNCTNKSTISGLQLESVLLDKINAWISEYCRADKIEIQNRQHEKITALEADADKLSSAIESKDKKIAVLYEDKLDGTITKEQYVLYVQRFENDKNELKSRLANVRMKAQESAKKNENIEHMQELIKKYTYISELTRTVAEEFLDTVLIGEKTDGQDREITINWKL
ncbi:MAG: recombinase family protein [Oscillospiraceae bacterium]|nr:recombinase family protein [Oscillospiraceae bacterium]